MSSSAAWAGLAGLMQGIGSGLKEKRDDELQAKKDAQREALLQLQQDAEQKRQQFLIDYKVKAEGAADEAKQARHASDVVGTVTNPETGEVMGRTKGGDTTPLVTTSGTYQAAKAAKLAAQAENTTALAHNRESASKGPANPAYRARQPTSADPYPNDPDVVYDPTGKTPFSSNDINFVKQYAAARDARLSAGKSDPNTNDPDIGYSEKGGNYASSNLDLVKQLAAKRDARLGGADMGAKQSGSPSQPQAPTMEEIIAQANAAVKRGAPQDAVEAKMKALMQQYGYQPQ